MANDGTGLYHDEADPADSDVVSDGAKDVRDVRIGANLRLEKEHVTFTDATALDSGLIKDGTGGGEHKEGSAIGYYESSAPTKRPDSYTALDSDDAGRLWQDSDDGLLKIWDGSAWGDVIVSNVPADAITGAQIADDAIDSEHYTDGSIDTVHIAADAVDSTLIADDAVDTEHIADDALSADATGRALMQDAFLTAAKVAASTGIGRVASGTYTGLGAAGEKAISGLGFQPLAIIFIREDRHAMGLFLDLTNGAGVAGDIHFSHDQGSIVGAHDAAVTTDPDGFTIGTSKAYNLLNIEYTYVAIGAF